MIYSALSYSCLKLMRPTVSQSMKIWSLIGTHFGWWSCSVLIQLTHIQTLSGPPFCRLYSKCLHSAQDVFIDRIVLCSINTWNRLPKISSLKHWPSLPNSTTSHYGYTVQNSWWTGKMDIAAMWITSTKTGSKICERKLVLMLILQYAPVTVQDIRQITWIQNLGCPRYSLQ